MAENGVRMLCRGYDMMGRPCPHDSACMAHSGKVFRSVYRMTEAEARREQTQARGEHRHSGRVMCFRKGCERAPERVGEHVRCRCVGAPMDVDNYCGICGFAVLADWEWDLITGFDGSNSGGFVETKEREEITGESTVTIIATVKGQEKVRVSGVREDSIAYEVRKDVPTLTFEFQDDSMAIGYIPNVLWYRTESE